MNFPSLSSGCELYAPQTKIWEGGTKDEMQMFDTLFKGVSTHFGPLTLEKCVEHLHFIFCSTFPNLRLGSINLRYFFVRYMACEFDRHIVMLSSSCEPN